MQVIRVTHHHEPGYGWSFDSPDIQGFIGGPENDADFEGSCRHAESAVKFFLECDAEERGEPVAQDVVIEHLVPTRA